MPEKGLLSIGKAAKYLGVSVDTLRRWDASGKLPAQRGDGGHRYYLRDAIELFRDDLFAIARVWAASSVAPALNPAHYSATHDYFQARLERMASEIDRITGNSGIASLVAAVAGEIGNNSYDHNLGNWPDVPGVFFAYDVNKRVVVLADRGVGIRSTLSRVRPDLKTDRDALGVAMTERLSGRAPEQRGNGLKFVRKVATDHRIGVVLQSGTAAATIGVDGSKELVIELADRNLPGVLARIEFEDR